MRLLDFLELAPEFAEEFAKYKAVVAELDDHERRAVAFVGDSRKFVRDLAKELGAVYEAIFKKSLVEDLLGEASMAVKVHDKEGLTLAFLVLDLVWSSDDDARLGAKIVAQGVRPEYKGFGLNRVLLDATEIFLGCFVADKCFDARHELTRMFEQLEPGERRLFLVAPCGAASKKRLASLPKHGFAKTSSDWGQDEDEVVFERELALLPAEEP
jgi:hypothetical protein